MTSLPDNVYGLTESLAYHVKQIVDLTFGHPIASMAHTVMFGFDTFTDIRLWTSYFRKNGVVGIGDPINVSIEEYDRRGEYHIHRTRCAILRRPSVGWSLLAVCGAGSNVISNTWLHGYNGDVLAVLCDPRHLRVDFGKVGWEYIGSYAGVPMYFHCDDEPLIGFCNDRI